MTKEHIAEMIRQDISVVSKGFTGKEWIAYLKAEAIYAPEGFIRFLESEFIPSPKGITTKIAYFKGADLKREFGETIVVKFDVTGFQTQQLSIDAALLLVVSLQQNPESLGGEICLRHKPYSLPHTRISGDAYTLSINLADTGKVSLRESSADFKFYASANYAIAYE